MWSGAVNATQIFPLEPFQVKSGAPQRYSSSSFALPRMASTSFIVMPLLILTQLALLIGSRSEKERAAPPSTSGETSKQTHASFLFMAETRDSPRQHKAGWLVRLRRIGPAIGMAHTPCGPLPQLAYWQFVTFQLQAKPITQAVKESGTVESQGPDWSLSNAFDRRVLFQTRCPSPRTPPA